MLANACFAFSYWVSEIFIAFSREILVVAIFVSAEEIELSRSVNVFSSVTKAGFICKTDDCLPAIPLTQGTHFIASS